MFDNGDEVLTRIEVLLKIGYASKYNIQSMKYANAARFLESKGYINNKSPRQDLLLFGECTITDKGQELLKYIKEIII
jgi:hypothetical protein